jgi:hypothetical protein
MSEWLKYFLNGRESVDYTRCGRPSTLTNDINIEHVRFVVQSVMKEYAGDIDRCSNISWKHSQYSSQRFATLGSKMLPLEHNET